MAVPQFPSGELFGIFAVDDLAAPTAFYIYADGANRAEMKRLLGHKDKDGLLVDGALTDYLQSLGASNNAVDLTTAVVEVDTDPNSPHLGRVRMTLTVGATAA